MYNTYVAGGGKDRIGVCMIRRRCVWSDTLSFRSPKKIQVRSGMAPGGGNKKLDGILISHR